MHCTVQCIQKKCLFRKILFTKRKVHLRALHIFESFTFQLVHIFFLQTLCSGQQFNIWVLVYNLHDMKGGNSAVKRLNYLFLQQNRRPDASSKEELRPNIRVSPNLSVALSCNNQTKLSDALQQSKLLSHPAMFRKLTSRWAGRIVARNIQP